MNYDTIADRLRAAIETLDYSADWLDGDADALADILAVICELDQLRLALEMAPFRSPVTP